MSTDKQIAELLEELEEDQPRYDWRSKYNSTRLHLHAIYSKHEVRLCDQNKGKISNLRPERHRFGKKCDLCLEIEAKMTQTKKIM
jgi:hypothetical protein